MSARSRSTDVAARAWTVVLAVALLAGGWIGLTRSAPLRHRIDYDELARAVVRASEAGEAEDPTNQLRLRRMRDGLAQRPLDAKGRSYYAIALLSVSQARFDDTSAARFHARAAQASAPVTVSVVSRSARVLALSGRLEEGLEHVRTMYDYAPEDAADVLLKMVPWADVDYLRDATPSELAPRLALARELAGRGRREAARSIDLENLDLWPRDLQVLRRAAELSRSDGAWESLEALLRDAPQKPAAEAAPLMVYRGLARAHLAQGDTTRADEARADLRLALQLAPVSPSLRTLTGDAYAVLGDDAVARRQWKWALFETPADRVQTQVSLLRRLARSEAEHGKAEDAVQHWRAILDRQPEHAEARRALRRLVGSELNWSGS